MLKGNGCFKKKALDKINPQIKTEERTSLLAPLLLKKLN